MFTLREIIELIPGTRVQGAKGQGVKGISIDSRTVKRGELFIPLKGKRFDGRKFIPQALAKGAAVLETRDGLKALQTLAAYHRSQFNIPVIGVTGSVGKTTTKDMIAAILSRHFPTLKNEQNFNNEIGVPLTLLRLTGKHRAAVIEMGMRGPGEIALLVGIARPTIAVVTNIGEAHLQRLKSKRNIAKAKAEIFSFLSKGSRAVINQDDEYFEHLQKRAANREARVTSFGILEKADVTVRDLAGIKLPQPGEHNIYNALAAIAVARILKVPRSKIVRGLTAFRPSNNRWDVINRRDGVKIINDTYNANPQSMAAALKVLAWLPGRKIAVLGDMLELGGRSRAAHQRIGRLSRRLGVDYLLTIGQEAKAMIGDHHFPTKKPAIRKLKQLLRPGDRVLVKASRGLHLEEVVEAIRKT